MDLNNQSNKLPSPINSDTGLHNTIPGIVAVDNPNQNTEITNNPLSINSNPLTAEDDDLIEKEWVDKINSIVKTYKEDPFNQLRQLNSLKADYIKKRYNKIIQDGE